MFVVNGKNIIKTTFEQMQVGPESIQSFTIFQKEIAFKKYKLKGIDGIVEVELK